MLSITARLRKHPASGGRPLKRLPLFIHLNVTAAALIQEAVPPLCLTLPPPLALLLLGSGERISAHLSGRSGPLPGPWRLTHPVLLRIFTG